MASSRKRLSRLQAERLDRTPQLDAKKIEAGSVLVDTLREIAANKVCTLVSRCEIRDLVDLRAILLTGIRLEDALADANRKDGGVNAATLAWLLDELSIGAEAELPGGVTAAELDQFRKDLVSRLRRLSHPQAGPPV